MNYEKAVSNIRRELKTYIKEHGIKSLILGVSGGMDSCLCAALAKPVCDELNIPLIGVSLPSEANNEDEISRAELTMRAFCTKTEIYYIDSLYSQFKEINKLQFIPEINDCEKSDTDTYIELNKMGEDAHNKIIKDWKIRAGNIKARIRMIYLYNVASMNSGMVLSTDNYTEYLLGFWTLHGDVGDYGMIQELWKSEVYDMAEWLMNNEYPEYSDAYYSLKHTIKAMATDGLGVSSLGDLGQILPDWKGTSRDGYKEVDRILHIWIELYTKKLSPRQIETLAGITRSPVIQRHLRTQFKRNNPVNINRNLIIE